MAFVSEQERGMESLDYKNAHLGPGKYIGHEFQKKITSYAPFSSLSERQTKEFSTKRKFVTPGPGQYQVAKPIGGLDISLQSINQENSIILKLQPQSTNIFKSRQQRFKSFETPNPGPGTYTKDLMSLENKNIRSSPGTPEKAKFLDGLRNFNQKRKITSIPNKSYKMQNDQMNSFQDTNEKENLNKTADLIGVGPGKYDVKDTFSINKNKGPSWAKSQIQRFKEENQSKSLGPGIYNLNKKVVPKYKQNQSSSFVSESVRSYYDQMYYNTQNEKKAQYRKETGYKNNNPGPGQYPIEQKVKAIEIKSKPILYQYFGSNQPRFDIKEKDYNLAPGQYNLEGGFKEFQNKAEIYQPYDANNQKAPFLSKQARDDGQQNKKISDIPGVGSYDVNNVISINENLVKKYHMGYKGKFGTHAQRFLTPTEQISQPGPGQYNVSREKKDERSNADNSNFKSTTVRNCFGKMNEDIPTAVEYNVVQHSIQYKLEKQKLFQENLKKIEVNRPGFDTSNERFPHYKQKGESENKIVEENNFSVSYIKDNLGEQNKKRSNTFHKYNDYNQKTQTQNQSQAPFLFNSKKLDYINVNDVPGPGKYRNNTIGQWNKKSYNIKYQAPI